ncbi:alpha/beta hydrolase [Williamsia sp. 1138]|nr:alpha/beta hydrolase [Williamsia sp. 1138]
MVELRGREERGVATTNGLGPTPVTFTGSGGLALAADHWEPASAGGSANDSPTTILLLHGGGQTRHSWKKTGEVLARRGAEVFSLDSRGHGDSDWDPDADYSLPAMTADGLAVLEQIPAITGRTGPVSVVGASLGGMTGIGIAALAPVGTVDKLVLVDVVPRFEKSGSKRIRDFMSGNVDGFDDLHQAAAAIADYLPHRKASGPTEGLKRNLRQREDGRWYWHWDPAFLTPPHDDPGIRTDVLEKQAMSLTIPIQLIRGQLSDVVSEESVRHFLDLVPDAEFVELTGAGHTAAGDDNDAFTTAVIDFVGR